MSLEHRVRVLNSGPVRPAGRYVLYWMQANRRVHFNHALLVAAELAASVDLPVLCYEELTCSHPDANDRSHTFILEGVPERERGLRKLGIGYAFYLQRRRSDPDDWLKRLAGNAAALVTDDHPTLSLPSKLALAQYAVDSSCLVPMSRIEKLEYAAYTIRPKINRLLAAYLHPPAAISVRRKFRDALPPFHARVSEREVPALLASCEIDHAVPPSITFRGRGSDAGKHLDRFLHERLRLYARHRNEPSAHATSDLSPYLHFGLISPLEVALRANAFAEEHKLMAGEFLEQLIVRRELAFNFARYSRNPRSLAGLPDWTRKTLEDHARDLRPAAYTLAQFVNAQTHDALWNATQKEMLLRGKIHGYYRMYWGKKIIEWSATAAEALETMLHIHDRYALDGRDPNTYTGILWCFGLHDRPWPERPVFGKVRYMSLEGMKRKTGVDAYLKEIGQLELTGRDPFRIQ